MSPTAPCPVCGRVFVPKFDSTSNWCVDCANIELLDQSLEDTDTVTPEVFGE